MIDTLSPPHPTGRRWAVVMLAVALFTVGVAGALARKALVPLLIVTCLPLITLAGTAAFKTVSRASPATYAVGGLVLWAAISNFWGYDLHFVAVLQVLVTIALAVVATRATSSLPAALGERLDHCVIAGSVLLVLFLIEEKLSAARITTWFHPQPGLQIAAAFFPKIFVYAGGGAAVLAPTCSAVAALIYVRTQKLVWPVLYFLAAFVACAVMPMAAATLGVVLGGAAFVVAYYRPRFAFGVIFASFTVYLLLAPAISIFVLPSKTDPIPTVPTSDFGAEDVVSIHARFATWRHVADLIMERPCFGHGFDAARDLSEKNENLPGSILPAIPIHPHNGPLQLWLELGLVGVVLVGGVLAAAWRATLGLSDRPLAAAVVAGTLVASSIPILVSFSLWNTWWLATLGFAAMFAARAVTAVSARPA